MATEKQQATVKTVVVAMATAIDDLLTQMHQLEGKSDERVGHAIEAGDKALILYHAMCDGSCSAIIVEVQGGAGRVFNPEHLPEGVRVEINVL